MKKKPIALLLILSMLLTLIAGCGPNTSDDGNTPDIGPESSQSNQPNQSDQLDMPEKQEIDQMFPGSTFICMEDTAAVQPYLAAAEARKVEILNSKTEIVHSDEFIPGETYTGTAYYVSNSGSDGNDGKSPETAWKTVLHLNEEGRFQPGDAVFFERGGVYRLEDPLYLSPYVTYSAYGEGEKPVLTRVEENAAASDHWALWYEDQSGKKIWKYYKELPQPGCIIFDDTSWAKLVWEWPSEEGWQTIEFAELDPANGIQSDINPYAPFEMRGTREYPTVEEALFEDMTFVWRTDIASLLPYPIGMHDYTYNGEIYLRCDAGNPGNLYADVEIVSGPSQGRDILIDAWDIDGYVLDNLALKYFVCQAVVSRMYRTDIVIQNCTVEWGAATLHIIESGEVSMSYIADGLYGMAKNAAIRNNYFLHCGNAGTFELGASEDNDNLRTGSLGDYIYEGNVAENCRTGAHWAYADHDGQGIGARFRSFTVKDNYILNTGYTYDNGIFDGTASIEFITGVQLAETVTVSGNVLIGSRQVLVSMPDPHRVTIDFSDNVFVQNRDGYLVMITGLGPDEAPYGALWLKFADTQ